MPDVDAGSFALIEVNVKSPKVVGFAEEGDDLFLDLVFDSVIFDSVGFVDFGFGF